MGKVNLVHNAEAPKKQSSQNQIVQINVKCYLFLNKIQTQTFKFSASPSLRNAYPRRGKQINKQSL